MNTKKAITKPNKRWFPWEITKSIGSNIFLSGYLPTNRKISQDENNIIKT